MVGRTSIRKIDKTMSLPADQRAQLLAVTAKVLAEQLRGHDLLANARIFGLVDQIRESAEQLRDELNPRKVIETAVCAQGLIDTSRDSTIIPFRRRSG